ncbi:hypothetical protein [Pseudomonas fluorescens]|uniref:Uncharacterized protein n=1 Tax=Pseudomonas fluorescens TaxID=294 RepID=A0A5E7BI30_PSEFL|nr:hypothetical protein [Pseudomonas fluorescens]VVN91235.1 hypothetical protein PS691_01883 [Pseudomonas fluorescens]
MPRWHSNKFRTEKRNFCAICKTHLCCHPMRLGHLSIGASQFIFTDCPALKKLALKYRHRVIFLASISLLAFGSSSLNFNLIKRLSKKTQTEEGKAA